MRLSEMAFMDVEISHRMMKAATILHFDEIERGNLMDAEISHGMMEVVIRYLWVSEVDLSDSGT
jgi:hypothetical protein